MTVSTENFYTQQIHQIEKLRFLSISRYKFKSRFWLSLNLHQGIWVCGFDGFGGVALSVQTAENNITNSTILGGRCAINVSLTALSSVFNRILLHITFHASYVMYDYHILYIIYYIFSNILNITYVTNGTKWRVTSPPPLAAHPPPWLLSHWIYLRSLSPLFSYL